MVKRQLIIGATLLLFIAWLAALAWLTVIAYTLLQPQASTIMAGSALQVVKLDPGGPQTPPTQFFPPLGSTLIAGFVNANGQYQGLLENIAGSGDSRSWLLPNTSILSNAYLGDIHLAQPHSLQVSGIPHDRFQECAKRYSVKFTLDDSLKPEFYWSQTPDQKYAELIKLIQRHAESAILPLQIYGPDGTCDADYFGSGSAIAIGYASGQFPQNQIELWVTVEHVILTDKYFDFSANAWELAGVPVMVLGCKDDQWCLLATPQIGTTMPLSTVTRYSIGDLPAVGDLTYGYGCSQFFERAVKQGWKVVNIKFFCQGTLGALIMRQSLTGLLVGGNVCVNNPAMPGYSGSAILTYSSDPSTGIFDRLNLIGTLNSGYPGLFSCIWSLPKTLLKDAQAAFQNLQRGFNGQKPEPPDATVALPAQARFANWGDIPSEQKALWAEIWNANPYMVAVKGSTTHFAFYLNNDSEKFLGTLIVVENDALRQARKEGLFKPGLVQQLDVTLVSAQAISKEES